MLFTKEEDDDPNDDGGIFCSIISWCFLLKPPPLLFPAFLHNIIPNFPMIPPPPLMIQASQNSMLWTTFRYLVLRMKFFSLPHWAHHPPSMHTLPLFFFFLPKYFYVLVFFNFSSWDLRLLSSYNNCSNIHNWEKNWLNQTPFHRSSFPIRQICFVVILNWCCHVTTHLKVLKLGELSLNNHDI